MLPLAIFFGVCGVGTAITRFVSNRAIPTVLAWLGTLASLLVLSAGGMFLSADVTVRTTLWPIPGIGELTVAPDRLSGVFVIVAGLVFLTASIFSRGYLVRYLDRYSLRVFEALYFPLLASVILVLVAGDLLLFLLAWEAMSILSYLLVSFEYRHEAHTQAGYLMLAMGEAGTLAAIVAFLLLAVKGAGLEFSALKAAAASLDPGARWVVFLLSFFGFGVKAGLVPFNSWLPRAHPAAPGNVSAILSGTILNLGLYGIVRVNVDLLPMTLIGPGVVALVVGTLSAFIGILYATTENDLKVMLAHSSIESIGIVTAGLGAGFVFMAAHLPTVAMMAFVIALYHMTNHSVYKALLFLGAASVDAEVGTRDLDRLGGLVRRMPWTTLLFLAGALSISALPPFNGFVSEWLTLQMMLRSVELGSRAVKVVFALCGAGLALTAALAVTCFVKAVAMGFLGQARSEIDAPIRERRSAIASMGVLAVLCLVLGVLPTAVIPVLSDALTPMTGASAVDALVPPFFAGSPLHGTLPPAFASEFHDLGAQVGQALPGPGLVVMHRGGEQNPVVFAISTSYMLPVLLGLVAVVYLIARFALARHRRTIRRACWDGGVVRLLPEMSYTGTGFSNPVRVIFDAILQPTAVEDTRETVAEHFRTAIRRKRTSVHIVDRVVLMPVRRAGFTMANGLAAMHHGRLNAYVGYGLLALIIALLVASRWQ